MVLSLSADELERHMLSNLVTDVSENDVNQLRDDNFDISQVLGWCIFYLVFISSGTSNLRFCLRVFMGNVGGKEFTDKDSLKEMTQSAFSKLGKVVWTNANLMRKYRR